MLLKIAGGRTLEFGSRTLVMGILNVTPDSFADGGRHDSLEKAVAFAGQMLAEGAAILDIGGESTRPGFTPVSPDEELSRVLPVTEALRHAYPDAILSIDTSKPDVARHCLEAGCHIVNDVTAFEAGGMEMLAAIADYQAGGILMHHTPGGIQDIQRYLGERLAWACGKSGLDSQHFALDPGIGFGKSLDQNLQATACSDTLHALGRPVLIAPSRKSFIGQVTGRPVEQRLPGTIAAVTTAVLMGADMVRVHDVAEAVDAAELAWQTRKALKEI